MSSEARRRQARELVGWSLLAGSSYVTVDIAVSGSGTGLADSSSLGPLTAVLPGAALGAVGVYAWTRRGDRSGPLLWAAGLTWQAALWNDQSAPLSLLFTLGLAAGPVYAPLLVHALLLGRSGVGRSTRAAVATCFWLATLQGLVPALLADPRQDGCSLCARNLLALTDQPGLASQLSTVGLHLTTAWSFGLATLLLLGVAVAPPAQRRREAPTSLSAVVILLLLTASSAHRARAGDLPDGTALRLFTAQAAALLLASATVVASWSAGRRARQRVARLVLDLGTALSSGGLRDALAEALDDSSLQLAYVVRDDRLADPTGAPVVLEGPVTTLLRRGRPVAVLQHRSGLLDEPGAVREVARAAQLVLDNERLQAEVAEQLRALTASRRRLVAAGDLARRRLERDVHDGAQQRLVALLLDVRRVRRSCPAGLSAAAEAELLAAVDELRTIAQGIFPAILVEEGLAEAVQAFAEGAELPLRVVRLPEHRADPAAEGAAYFVLAQAVCRSAAVRATVTLHCTAEVLSLRLELDAPRPTEGWLTDLEDRVGAVEGHLHAELRSDGVVELRMELPCGL